MYSYELLPSLILKITLLQLLCMKNHHSSPNYSMLHKCPKPALHRPATGFPKLVNTKTKAGKTLLGPIKLINPSVRMVYKGQSSFGIIAIMYTYRACKTLFRPIKPSVWMAYKGQSSFGKPAVIHTDFLILGHKYSSMVIEKKKNFTNVHNLTQTFTHQHDASCLWCTTLTIRS